MFLLQNLNKLKKQVNIYWHDVNNLFNYTLLKCLLVKKKILIIKNFINKFSSSWYSLQQG